jgi:hypothetical protein
MNNCRFLVWNINQNNRFEILEALQAWEEQYQYDVLVLLECTIPMAKSVRDRLQWRWLGEAWEKDGNNYLKVFSKLPENEVTQLALVDWNQVLIEEYGNSFAKQLPNLINNVYNKIRHIRLTLHNQSPVDCFFVHFYSFKHENRTELLPLMIKILNGIWSNLIINNNDSRILWAGDFNLEMSGTESFINYALVNNDEKINVFPTRKAFFATEHSGDALDKYFYNPVGLVSADYSDPFYHHSNPNRYRLNYSFYLDIKNNTQQYFNLIDGVLVGKGLIPYFKDESYRFLDCYLHHNRQIYLYDDSQLRPNKNLYSDHFPFIFELDFSTL